jgi:hypothetical protein
MPEIGDTVRVYFPGNDPSKAFACSSLGKTAKSDPKEKSWTTPQGKEILMNDQGLYLINKAGLMFIEMTDEGISLQSDSTIQIAAAQSIEVYSKEKVRIEGSAGVLLLGGVTEPGGTPTASVEIDGGGVITLIADTVYNN